MLYFSINIALSLLIVAAVYLLSQAPFRQRFQLILLALISWLLPYDMIAGAVALFEAPAMMQPVWAFGERLQTAVEPVLVNPIATAFSWSSLLLAVTGFGLLWFITDLWAITRHIQKQQRQAQLYKNADGIRYYAVKGLKGAHTSGYFKPVVWFNADYLTDSTLDSVLFHERQHIQQHDQFWLLLITFIQRLLWWNPVVRILSQQARQYIELSCDEVCARFLGRKHYRTDLASLIMGAESQPQAALSNNVLGKKNFNINRIQCLHQEYIMTKRNLLIFILTISLFIGAFASTLLAKTADDALSGSAAPIVHELYLQDNQVLMTLLLEVGENVDDDPTTLDADVHEARQVKIVAELNEWSQVHMAGYALSLMPSAINESTYQIDFIVDNTPGAINEQRFPSIHVSKNKVAGMIIGNENDDRSLQVRLLIANSEDQIHEDGSVIPPFPEKS
ncbi:M56 family metallopeptidase [Marinicella sp. W31]|uniref:M56 family metallopeptidase n=1 Tax=Marinicella sp. W31 TaxID=3023713 RepID=UPI0037565B5D